MSLAEVVVEAVEWFAMVALFHRLTDEHPTLLLAGLVISILESLNFAYSSFLWRGGEAPVSAGILTHAQTLLCDIPSTLYCLALFYNRIQLLVSLLLGSSKVLKIISKYCQTENENEESSDSCDDIEKGSC